MNNEEETRKNDRKIIKWISFICCATFAAVWTFVNPLGSAPFIAAMFIITAME